MAEPKALVRNAGDPEQVRSAKETEQDRLARRISNLGVVLSTYQGREDMWDFLADCGIWKDIFDGHNSRMSYNAGQHALGLRRLAAITTHYPEQYLKMQAESIQREKERVEPEPMKPE